MDRGDGDTRRTQGRWNTKGQGYWGHQRPLKEGVIGDVSGQKRTGLLEA